MATGTTLPKVQAASANAKCSAAGSKSCNMCEKDGLLILPVRYSAAAATDAHNLGAAQAMALPKGNFGAGVTTIGPKKATYLLRTVRYGYIHVYMPSSKTAKWKIYAVTREGYVFNYPLDADLDRSKEGTFGCKQSGHKELAQCISIEHPKQAGKIYLAFSDVRWTAPVRKRIEANTDGCRDKRMQSFDAGRWASGDTGKQKDAESIAHVADYVLEYKGGVAVAALGSPFHFNDRTGEAKALQGAMGEHDKGNGVFFALWDAPGIAQELNNEQILAFGAAMQPFERRTWTASAIDGLQHAIEEMAEKDEDEAAEKMKNDSMQNYAIYSLFDGGKAYDKQVKSIDEQKEKEMGKVKSDAWKPYTESYSPDAVKEFRKSMKAGMSKAEAATLNPLADDYNSWLSSDQFKNVFRYDFDEHDQVKGADYAELFRSCIVSSADRKQTFQLLQQWAAGNLKDRGNPLLRSLILNHDPTAEKVEELSRFPLIELREPLAKLIEANKESGEAAEKTANGFLARANKAGAGIIHEAGGPIAKFLATSGEAAAAKVLTIAMCVRTRSIPIYHPVEGNPHQWISFLAHQMYERMPAKNRPSIGSLTDNLKKTFQENSPKDGPIKVPQYIIFDVDEAVQASAGAATKRAAGNAIFAPGVRAVLTEENITGSFMPRFRAMTQGEVAYGAIGTVFNMVNWIIAQEEFKKSNSLNRNENGNKLTAAIVSTCTAGVQTVGNALKALGATGLTYSTRLASTGVFLEVAARWIGAPAAAVGAVYDAKHAKEELEAGHTMLAILYGSSAFFGGLLVLATLAGATSLFFPLLIILIVIGVLIAWKKSREINEWLAKCYFGPQHSFSPEEERKTFEALTS